MLQRPLQCALFVVVCTVATLAERGPADAAAEAGAEANANKTATRVWPDWSQASGILCSCVI